MENERCIWLLSLSLFMSIQACLFTAIKEGIKLELDKSLMKVPYHQNIITSGRWIRVLINWVIILAHPYPFLVGKTTTMYNGIHEVEMVYHINDFLHMVSMIRIVKMGLKFINLTTWKSNSSRRVCQMYGCEADTMFGVKAMMKNYPISFLFSGLLAGILYFAILVKYCESPMNKATTYDSKFDLHELVNCIWLVMCTVTTVGYGDLFPRTILGRAVIFVCAIYGVVVSSVMVVAIQNTFTFSNLEEKAFTCINKLKARNQLYKEATYMVSMFLRFNRRPPTSEKLLKKVVRDLRSISHNFMKNVR